MRTIIIAVLITITMSTMSAGAKTITNEELAELKAAIEFSAVLNEITQLFKTIKKNYEMEKEFVAQSKWNDAIKLAEVNLEAAKKYDELILKNNIEKLTPIAPLMKMDLNLIRMKRDSKQIETDIKGFDQKTNKLQWFTIFMITGILVIGILLFRVHKGRQDSVHY